MDDVTIETLYNCNTANLTEKRKELYKEKRGKNQKVKIKHSLKEQKNCDENVDIMKNVLLIRFD